jgi:SEC-C motif
MVSKIGEISEKSKNEIHFYCIHCRIEFFCDVGEITLGFDAPEFEKPVVCPKCGVRYSGGSDEFTDHFELTEIGQTHLSEISFGGPVTFWNGEAIDIGSILDAIGNCPGEENCEHESRKIGRNENCPCRSGRKYKKCCLRNKPVFDPDLKVSPEGR